jgi:hypothetical protein
MKLRLQLPDKSAPNPNLDPNPLRTQLNKWEQKWQWNALEMMERGGGGAIKGGGGGGAKVLLTASVHTGVWF